MDNIKAAIFDLDGTLVDSMWIWEEIDIEYLNKKGHAVPLNLKDKINHLSFDQTALYFKEFFALEDSLETIMNEWNTMAYTHYSKNITLKEGALELLNKLKASGVKIALATSNSTHLLEAVLKNNNIYSYFDSITTTSEVTRGKDNPDVYLLAAKKLGVEPTSCVVFEDIVPAIIGAKAANMKTVAIYDKSAHANVEELTSLADKYILNFHEIIELIP